MKLYKVALVAIVSGFMAVSCSDSDSKTAPSSHPTGGSHSGGTVSDAGRGVSDGGRYSQGSGGGTYDTNGNPYQPVQCDPKPYMRYQAPASPKNCQMTPYTPPQEPYQPPYSGPQMYVGGDQQLYTKDGGRNGYNPVNHGGGYMDCNYQMEQAPCPPPVKDPYGRDQGYQDQPPQHQGW